MDNLSNAALLDALKRLGACSPAVEYIKQNGYDLRAALVNCPYHHWLEWLYTSLMVNRNDCYDFVPAEWITIAQAHHDKHIAAWDAVWGSWGNNEIDYAEFVLRNGNAASAYYYAFRDDLLTTIKE